MNFENTNNTPARKTRKPIAKADLISIFKMLEMKKPTKEIITFYSDKFSRRTVLNVISRLLEHGKEYIDTFIDHYTKRKLTITAEKITSRTEVIKDLIDLDNTISQESIRLELQARNMVASQPTISREIKKISYSRKRLALVPEARNSIRIIEERYRYAVYLNTIHDNKIIFLDESGFNLHVNSHYGYSPANTKAFTIVPSNRGRNVTLLAAISTIGIVNYEIFLGSLTAAKLNEFLELKIIPRLSESQTHLIMDNCRAHKTTSTQSLCAQKGKILKFLPPYTPHLNPIEEFFSSVKARFSRQRRSCHNFIDIQNCLSQILEEYNVQISNFYVHSRTFIEKALSRQEFY